MKSIKGKILCVVISGILVVTIALSVICIYSTSHILQNDADMIIEALCEKEAAVINDTLGDIQKSVHIMEEYALSELDNAESLSDAVYLERYTSKMAGMFLDIASNTEGAVAYYVRFNPEITTPTAGFFISADSESNELVAFEPTDLSKYSENDIEHVGWYYAPVNAGEPIWMSPYYNRNNDILMISYIVPMYKHNVLVGIVGMDINFSLLTEAVDNISVYDKGSACLVDTDGSTLYEQISEESVNISGAETNVALSTCQLTNGMSLRIVADYIDIQKESYSVINMDRLCVYCNSADLYCVYCCCYK